MTIEEFGTVISNCKSKFEIVELLKVILPEFVVKFNYLVNNSVSIDIFNYYIENGKYVMYVIDDIINDSAEHRYRTMVRNNLISDDIEGWVKHVINNDSKAVMKYRPCAFISACKTPKKCDIISNIDNKEYSLLIEYLEEFYKVSNENFDYWYGDGDSFKEAFEDLIKFSVYKNNNIISYIDTTMNDEIIVYFKSGNVLMTSLASHNVSVGLSEFEAVTYTIIYNGVKIMMTIGDIIDGMQIELITPDGEVFTN